MGLTVTITECYGDRRTHTSSHPTDSVDRAISLAVEKAYGRGRFFVRDSGLRDCGMFGQIGHHVDSQRNLTSIDTGRVRIDVEG